MPSIPRALKLPDEVRRGLHRRLVESRFGDYHAHAAWLKEQGFEIGKSALHTYASTYRALIEADDEAAPGDQLLSVIVVGQRIECLKVAASLKLGGVDVGAVQADAELLMEWAKR